MVQWSILIEENNHVSVRREIENKNDIFAAAACWAKIIVTVELIEFTYKLFIKMS